jgi:hypothetical protein
MGTKAEKYHIWSSVTFGPFLSVTRDKSQISARQVPYGRS